MPRRGTFVNPVNPELEHLRDGTRQQFESEWLHVPAGEKREFRHDLEEIPWSFSVLKSDDATGSIAKPAGNEASYIDATTTWDPADPISNGNGETHSLTVTGAELGDYVLVGPPYDLEDMLMTGYVQAADTVEIRIHNRTGADRNLASGVWNVRVIKASSVSVSFADIDDVKGTGERSATITNNTGADAYFKVRAL